MRKSISVVINTLNRASHLRNALLALRYQRHPRFEVVVVNGPSTDDTMMVLAEHRDVKVVQCAEANLSISRNLGIAEAAGEIICFIDDDGVPEPNWLDRIEAAYGDPKIGAAGGYIRDVTGVQFQCKATVCDRFGRSHSYDDKATALAASKCHPGAWNYPTQTGCNSSFRRSALVGVGGFDETYVYFLDETDVVVRLIDAGWQVAYAEGAEVHHRYASSAQRDDRRVPISLYHPFRSKAYFAATHSRRHHSLDEIFTHLAEHSLEITRANKWYLANKWITQEHYDKLARDMETGLRDGVKQAFSGARQRRMFSAPPPFRPFETQLAWENRVRVCLLSQEYPPGPVGGIGEWTRTLAQSLAGAGHEVTVIARAEDGAPHTVDFVDGVWVHRIVPQWQPNRTDPPLGDLPQVIRDYAYTALDEVLRVHQIRGLSLVSWPIWDLEGAAVAAQDLIPNIMSLHTTFKLTLPSQPEWQSNPAYRRDHVDKIIEGERRMLASAQPALANSVAIMTDCESAYGVSTLRHRAALAPHGVPDYAASLGPRHVDHSRRVLLFAGRLEARKGVDTLFDALPGLMAERDNLFVRIIGKDSQKVKGTPSLREAFERKWARASWRDRVSFEGEVDRETLLKAYRDCDVFVAPSRYESFGLVAVEAMVFARPVAAGRCGGLKEIVDHGKTGLLFEPGDVQALSEALARLLDDPILQRAMGQAGRRRYEAAYTTEIMRDQVLRIYRDVLARRKAFSAAE